MEGHGTIGVIGMKIRQFIVLTLFLLGFNREGLLCQDTLMTIGTNFWNQAWGGVDPWKNGYQNAIVLDSVDLPKYNPWKPEFIEEISFYSVLRFMDYGEINNNQVEVFWDDRTKKDDVNQHRMALDWMIDLCNRAHCDLWFCLPEKAAPDYWQGAAELIKEKLNSDLRVYIEWSNETWNPQFIAYQTGIDSGKVYDLWFPGDMGQSWGEARLSARYTAFILVRIWKKFAEAFGDEFDSRVVKALCGSASNNWWDAALFHALSDVRINPDNILPDAFGIAPYVGGNLNGSDPDILNKMNQAQNGTENQIKKVRAELDGNGEWVSQMPPHPGLEGINMICYEAGQHIVTNSSSFAVNPDAYGWYINYLNMLKKHIRGPAAHYTHSGTWGNMAWGAKNKIGQPAGEAPKFIALNNWHILNVKADPGPQYTLSVTHGSGDGNFYSGMYAFIQAEESAEGYVFDRWEGDTIFVTNIYKANTTVYINDQDISLTALYKEAMPQLRLEAEDAELTGVEVSNQRSGYSGTGYVNGATFDSDGDKITFTIEAAETAQYRLRIGYGGFYGEKYQYIYVNGNNLAYFHFPETSSWETIEYGMIDLNSGMNSISIVKSWGWMDVDFIEIEGQGIASVKNKTGANIRDYRLFDNYPNPFNFSTTIDYFIPDGGFVSIDVYNIAGQLVDNLVSAHQFSGKYKVQWDTSDKPIASGAYVYRISTDGYQAEKRMLLLK
jgi:hypothetical protein